jgi:hypothetical protein
LGHLAHQLSTRPQPRELPGLAFGGALLLFLDLSEEQPGCFLSLLAPLSLLGELMAKEMLH